MIRYEKVQKASDSVVRVGDRPFPFKPYFCKPCFSDYQKGKKYFGQVVHLSISLNSILEVYSSQIYLKHSTRLKYFGQVKIFVKYSQITKKGKKYFGQVAEFRTQSQESRSVHFLSSLLSLDKLEKVPLH